MDPTTTGEVTDADVVKGGPLDPNDPMHHLDDGGAGETVTDDGGAGDEGTATPPAAQPQATAQGPIFVNGRQFKDAAELAQYTSQLEAARATHPLQADPAKPTLIDGKPIGDVMINDPERYNAWVLEQAEERALARMNKVQTAQNTERAFWDDFFLKNPDLKDEREAVEFQFKSKWDELAKLPVEDAKRRLATDSRSFLNGILKRKGVKVQELPSGGASPLGASGAPAPKVTQPAPKTLSFRDQVRQLRKPAARA
jgi:hypothetical protein